MAALCLNTTVAARAVTTDLVWATGRVVDSAGHAFPGALVAVYDDSNKVVDYARTDGNGDYALAIPRRAIHLDHRKGKGFIYEAFTTVTRFVGGAAEFVADPLRAGVHAVTTSQASNFADPVTKGGIMAGSVVADQVLSIFAPHSRKSPLNADVRKMPGALLVKVVAPQSNDLLEVSRVYWIQEETFRAGGKQDHTLAAWLDPVQLMRTDSEKPSHVQSEYLRFTGARLEPSLAEAGQTVHIYATFQTPPEPEVHVTVVARNNRTGEKWEIQPKGNGHYEGELVVDKRFPTNDQVISILAYAGQQQGPGRRPGVERAIEGEGLWDPKKPYSYNPFLVVSRNRADLILTILSANKRRP